MFVVSVNMCCTQRLTKNVCCVCQHLLYSEAYKECCVCQHVCLSTCVILRGLQRMLVVSVNICCTQRLTKNVCCVCQHVLYSEAYKECCVCQHVLYSEPYKECCVCQHLLYSEAYKECLLCLSTCVVLRGLQRMLCLSASVVLRGLQRMFVVSVNICCTQRLTKNVCCVCQHLLYSEAYKECLLCLSTSVVLRGTLSLWDMPLDRFKFVLCALFKFSHLKGHRKRKLVCICLCVTFCGCVRVCSDGNGEWVGCGACAVM